ncbi:MAG: PfkB family carbohydrate kinase [Mariprofundaceae bacterium]|nr:PfkB family carbohydrate kinase [Mariprofundaceae bacterium]
MMDVLCIGHASYDITMSVPRQPAPNEKMQADAMQLAGGGPAANAAVCVARLGGKSGFCGYLGQDVFGDICSDEFVTEGVDASLIVRGEHPTPVSQILAKPDGARSVVNFKSNTPCLAADAIRLSQQPKVMLFDEHEPALSAQLCEQAKARDIPTVLDAGSRRHGTDALAMRVDYLVASAKFARQFCGTEDMQATLAILAGDRDNVVITLGKTGLIWSRRGETGAMSAPEVAVIDSTGAGDAFHGAFALALAMGLAWEDMLPRSCKCLCVQSVRYWFTWRIDKTRSHLIGDAYFFNSPSVSRGCAMYVQTLAGSRCYALHPG